MDFETFFNRYEFKDFENEFRPAIARRADPARHGDLKNWLSILEKLPKVKAEHLALDADTVSIGLASEINESQRQAVEDNLFALAPWRKGPFNVFGTYIDTEWRSDWKWQRLAPHIASLENKSVLDVGCGSGYHCWRMLGSGARYVLGIDPSMRFQIQHQALQRFAQDSRFDMLPLGIEDIPSGLSVFDSVFSMGVLYHRKDPAQHVRELFNLLKPGGQLVLETLIIDDETVPHGLFTPDGRYAQMRNVWSITTVDKTLSLMHDAGFTDPRCVDINVTSVQEQRQTQWMSFHSLQQFLDPNDTSLTVEGHPAPTRGLFIAEKPENA